MTGPAGHTPFRPALRRATFPQGKAWGRVTQKVTTLSGETRLTERYTYRIVDGKPTTQVASHQIISATREITYSYTYDDNGNILTVTETFTSPGAMQSVSTTTSYVYDSQNQLLRENNEAAGKTWTWIYDDAGNILSHKEYNYTTGTLGTALDTVGYTYGRTDWGDLLTTYDGVPITSDEIGNPLTVGGRSYTWKNGRQLATLSQSGTTWTYTYNADGLRIGRTDGTTTYQYIYADGQLVKQRIGTSTMSFAYDAAGTPMSVYYSGANYYYVTNLQGDVIAITNDAGAAVVSYTYDAWGKILSITGSMANTLGKYNPLRYRGYVYDRETELYYLQSRYYDPEMGRFINADNQLSTGDMTGIDLFVYCGNNPVNRVDPTGEAWWHWALGAAVVAACAVATVVTCGGFAAAATAVGMVSSGIAATTTAATVATAAFIGSATVYGTAVLTAVSSSNSVEEFNAQGNWGVVAATAGGAAMGGYNGYKLSSVQPPSQSQSELSQPPERPRHTTGRGSPKKNPNPNGSYTQIDDVGKIYSYAQFDGLGRQTMRIDFQGRPHAGVLPHIHLYTYPEQGGKVEYIFDLGWNLIG